MNVLTLLTRTAHQSLRLVVVGLFFGNVAYGQTLDGATAASVNNHSEDEMVAEDQDAGTQSMQSSHTSNFEDDTLADYEKLSPLQKSNNFLMKYAGRYLHEGKFIPAAAEIYKSEARDSAWAEPIEKRIQDVGATIADSPSIDEECRASVCRVQVKYENAGAPQSPTAFLEFGSKLEKQSRETSDPVDVFAGIENGTRVYYVFSLTRLFYQDPLQRILGKCRRAESCW